MGYQPIQNYGIIGNMHTTALVGLNGSIDWFCFPNHDSPSIFAALLDDHKGGYLKISPRSNEVTYKQFYWPETNVLITRFSTSDGVGEIADFMPVGIAAEQPGHHWLIRRVKVIRCIYSINMERRFPILYGLRCVIYLIGFAIIGNNQILIFGKCVVESNNLFIPS
ncbi:trehalase-like domain-containing protein [Aerosakkonemataceae cyanobacterium BLCC-F50]|uniref:Trehalase-like domain-containing protein n=1 Tax=Floridaenema flaviceps BLCC-F50 TaxID=3153642 RepID=A0ABV4XT11_9CYAN